MVVLRPPLNRVYDEVLSTFVAGWENGRPDKPRRNRDAHALDWATLPGLARLNVKHIEETARMLLAAVLRGDQAAAEWLADVLSKWWGTLDFYDEQYQLYDKTTFITIEDLGLDWPDFCTKFGLEADDPELQERLRPKLQQGAFQAALRNYWTDVRLLTIELMLDWVRAVPAASAILPDALDDRQLLLVSDQFRDLLSGVDRNEDHEPPRAALPLALLLLSKAGAKRSGESLEVGLETLHEALYLLSTAVDREIVNRMLHRQDLTPIGAGLIQGLEVLVQHARKHDDSACPA